MLLFPVYRWNWGLCQLMNWSRSHAVNNWTGMPSQAAVPELGLLNNRNMIIISWIKLEPKFSFQICIFHWTSIIFTFILLRIYSYKCVCVSSFDSLKRKNETLNKIVFFCFLSIIIILTVVNDVWAGVTNDANSYRTLPS